MQNTKTLSYITHDQRCTATSFLVNLKWSLFEEQYLMALKKTLSRLKLSAEILTKENLFKDPNSGLNQLVNFGILHPENSDLKWLIKTLKDYISSKKDYGNATYCPFAPAAGEFHQPNGVRSKNRGQD